MDYSYIHVYLLRTCERSKFVEPHHVYMIVVESKELDRIFMMTTSACHELDFVGMTRTNTFGGISRYIGPLYGQGRGVGATIACSRT